MYIKQLDALRAIAVTLVLVGHWLPEEAWFNRLLRGNSGYIGVTVFFVLSGFLITWILLQNRNKAEAAAIKKTTVVYNFFIRRALRIFPVYYLVVFLLLYFHRYTGTHIYRDFVYFLTYTVNINIFKNQDWDGMTAHLWSLSVEEQFYLVWPWVILYCRKAYLLPVMVLFVITGMISSYLFTTPEIDCLTTSCFDAFGLGALLSLHLVHYPARLPQFHKWVRFAALGSVLLLIIFFAGYAVFVPLRTLAACVALWPVTYIVMHHQEKTALNRVLSNRLLVGMGRISYGIYLFHLPLIYVTDAVLYKMVQRSGIVLSSGSYLALLLAGSFITLILLSWASWQWIEKPFLRLKSRFAFNATHVKTTPAGQLQNR